MPSEFLIIAWIAWLSTELSLGHFREGDRENGCLEMVLIDHLIHNCGVLSPQATALLSPTLPLSCFPLIKKGIITSLQWMTQRLLRRPEIPQAFHLELLFLTKRILHSHRPRYQRSVPHPQSHFLFYKTKDINTDVLQKYSILLTGVKKRSTDDQAYYSHTKNWRQ